MSELKIKIIKKKIKEKNKKTKNKKIDIPNPLFKGHF